MSKSKAVYEVHEIIGDTPDIIDLRECYKKVRKVWGFNPQTRVKDNDKKYKRAKAKRKWLKEEAI